MAKAFFKKDKLIQKYSNIRLDRKSCGKIYKTNLHLKERRLQLVDQVDQ